VKEFNTMASKDKSDRIISLVRGAIYVDVVARIDGKITELRFLKDHTDREIRNMVFDTQTPPLLGDDSIMIEEKAVKQAELEKAKQTIPTPPVVAKNRASRQDMINALRAAGITGVNVANRNALETAYAKLQGGDK
jgi:hypothetical protein